MSRPRGHEQKSRSSKRQRNAFSVGFRKAGMKVVKCTLNAILRKDEVHAPNAQKLRKALEHEHVSKGAEDMLDVDEAETA